MRANSTPLTGSVGFIGAGQMARALAGGFVRNKIVTPAQIIAADVVPAATDSFCQLLSDGQQHARRADSNAQVVSDSDIVFLAIKPQNVAEVFSQLQHADCADKLFISIVAGLTCKRLATGLGTDRLVRVMPNTPCLVGCGMSVFARYTEATDDDARIVTSLLASVGQVLELEETHLDAVTGLSGSGPAFVYQVIQAMAEGGRQAHLDPQVALRLAAQTVLGAATMVTRTGESPEVLTERVASPNGTTVAGLAVLEQEKLRETISAAVVAAAERSRQLGAAQPE